MATGGQTEYCRQHGALLCQICQEQDHKMSTSNERSLPAYIKTFRTFSLIMSTALEFLGYSYTAIKQRQTHIATPLNLSKDIFVGSKAEGISVTRESDTDCMVEYDGSICVDGIEDAVVDGCQQLLLTEMDDLYPGYTKLKLAFPDDLMRLSDANINSQICFEKTKGCVYLSSLFLNDYISQQNALIGEIGVIGPSHCTSGFFGTGDFVIAIRYKSKTLLKEWLARPRCHGWPSEDSLREVAKLDWHLVAVGPKQADDDYQYWRICFTLGELYLVKTFNITQLHLLVLLKYIMHKCLKPVCSAFSSYLAKNLVFWVVEKLSPENFKPENICSLLMMSIQMLRQAVENEQLKNYMIPSRNLMKEKMSSNEKKNIIPILDRFIEAGPGFIMNSPEFSKLQEAMKKVNDNPEFVQREIQRNIRFEKEFFHMDVFLSQVHFKEIQNIVRTSPHSLSEENKERLMTLFREYMDKRGLSLSDIHTEYHPPGLEGSVGQIPTSSRTSPRDLMLKEADHVPRSQPDESSQPGTDNSISPNYRDNTVNHRPSLFTSVFGDRGFFSPFGPGHRSDTTPSFCGCQDNMAFPQSPWQPTTEFTSSSSSSSTMYNVGLNNGSWSGQSIRTIRHADGSIEKIVNKTEDGRVCTTVSHTAPHGVTTTTTTCDQSAIGSGPSTDPRVTP